MARFKLSLLTPYTESTKTVTKDIYNAIYFEDVITDFVPQHDSYEANQKDSIKENVKVRKDNKYVNSSEYSSAFSYNEKVSFSQNSQKTLSFTMNRYIVKEDQYIENPFVNLLQNGSQILLTDQYGNEIFFTITNIKYTFKETNIIYDYSCQDSFSYQTSRQNQNYAIDNDASSTDFIGAKTADWWIIYKVVPECYLTNYSYIPCSRGLYENKDGIYVVCDSFEGKTDVKRVIKEPHKFSEESYYQTFAYSGSGLNANAALIDIASKIKMQLVTFEHSKSQKINNEVQKTKYFDRFFWIEPLNNDQRVGLTYSPKRDIQAFDLAHGGQSLTTMLNVQGPTYNDEIITLIPDVPLFFQDFFLRDEWKKEDYSEGLFTKACSGEAYTGSLLFTARDIQESKSRFIVDNSALLDKEVIDDTMFILVPIYNEVNGHLFKVNTDLYSYFTFVGDKESELNIRINTESQTLITKPSSQSWFLAQGTSGNYKLFYPGQKNELQKNANTYIAIAYPVNLQDNLTLTYADVYLKFYRDITSEEQEFAEIADKCPWLENKIIDFNYFKEQNIISRKEYNTLMNILLNDLRKVNGRLIYYTKAYYKALHDKTEMIANMTNQLDTLGAACQAAIIDPLATTGSIKDISYFENAYNTVFNTGIDEVRTLLNYNDIVSDYFTKYFNAEQRFLKNIYNFRQYFEAENPLRGKALYSYQISITQPLAEQWANITEFYGFSDNRFISINSSSYPYIYYAGYNAVPEQEDTTLWNYGKTFLPIFLNQNGKFTEITTASADKWSEGSLYCYPNFEGSESFCTNEKTRYNENKKYLKLSIKVPINKHTPISEQDIAYYYWTYNGTERKISSKSTVNYTLTDFTNINSDSSLYGLYKITITKSGTDYNTICRLDQIIEQNSLNYAVFSMLHQGEWNSTNIDILSLILSGDTSFEHDNYAKPINGVTLKITPVYFNNGYISFTEYYDFTQTIPTWYVGLLSASEVDFKTNWIYTHYNIGVNKVFIEQKPLYSRVSDLDTILNEMIKWAAGNIFYGISTGEIRNNLLSDDNFDYFSEEQIVFDKWTDKKGKKAKEAYMSSFPITDFFVKAPRYHVTEKTLDSNSKTYVFERLNQKNHSLSEYLRYCFGDPIYSTTSEENPYSFEEYQRISLVTETNESSYYRRVIDHPYAGAIAAGIVGAPIFGPLMVLNLPTALAAGVVAVGVGAAVDGIASQCQHWDTEGVSSKDYFGSRLNSRFSGYKAGDDRINNVLYAPSSESFETYNNYRKYMKSVMPATQTTIHSINQWDDSYQELFWDNAERTSNGVVLKPSVNINKYFHEIFEKNSAYHIYNILYRDKLANHLKDYFTNKQNLTLTSLSDVEFEDKIVSPLKITVDAETGQVISSESISRHEQLYMLWIRGFSSFDTEEPTSSSTIIKDFDKFDDFLNRYHNIGFSMNYYYPLMQYTTKVSLAGFDWDNNDTISLADIVTNGNKWSFMGTPYRCIYKIQRTDQDAYGYVAFFRITDYSRKTLASYMTMPDNIAASLPRLFDSATRADFNYLQDKDITQGFYEDVNLKTDLVVANSKEQAFNINTAYYTKEGQRIYTIKQLKENGSYCYLRNFTYTKEDVGLQTTFDISLSKYTVEHGNNGIITGVKEEILNPVYETVFILTQDESGYHSSKTIEINGSSLQLNLTVSKVQDIDGISNGSFWCLYHTRTDLPVLFSAAVAIEANLTEYWTQAYTASKYCEYFLPENWTETANQVDNLFAEGIYQVYKKDNNIYAQLLSTFLPEVNIWKQNGSIILKKYKWTYDTGEQKEQLPNAPYVLENQNINNESPTAIIMNNYVLRNALKNAYNVSDQEIIDKARKWNLEEIGTTTYYYSNAGGMRWKDLVQKYTNSGRFACFDGWYLMALRWLQQHYIDWDLVEYKQAQQQHDAIWNMLYEEYGHILLETVFKSETATSSADLFKEATLYFKDRAQPERAYNITIIDAASLDNYIGSEIRVGDGIQVNALDYYNQYDNIYQSLTQYLFITDISYTLRDASSIALTVNTVKYADTIVKRLAKLLK